MKCARLLLFLIFFQLPAAFAATSYCSGNGCDPSNGVYLPPYAANFLPGGIYGTTTTDNVLFHVNWTLSLATILFGFEINNSSMPSSPSYPLFRLKRICEPAPSLAPLGLWRGTVEIVHLSNLFLVRPGGH
jgi:hypothetical protein